MNDKTVADNGGLRMNEGKWERFDLLPPDFLMALAEHMGRCTQKYPDRNWERGMDWSKPFASMMRHAWKFWRGKSYDDEDPRMPGYRPHHMIAVAWNAMVEYCYETRGIGKDDRLALRDPTNTTVGVSWGDPRVNMGADVTSTYAMPPTQSPITPTSGPINTPAAPQWLVAGSKATPVKNEPKPKPFTFWYLATPYSKYPAGHESAAILSAQLAAILMERRVPVFAPIAHSHPISKYTKVSNTDHHFWIDADAPFIGLASGLIVVTAESWEESRGMAEEIKRFTAAGKPVVYWAPWCRPPSTVLETALPK